MFRCKYQRIVLELSQAQVAALVKMRQADISRIETGRLNPTPRELAALSKVLHCPPDRLMDHISADGLASGAEARDQEANRG
jgi:transcriptional regulator with XRE-family HTH domain